MVIVLRVSFFFVGSSFSGVSVLGTFFFFMGWGNLFLRVSVLWSQLVGVIFVNSSSFFEGQNLMSQHFEGQNLMSQHFEGQLSIIRDCFIIGITVETKLMLINVTLKERKKNIKL